jgi:hypothetical protein
MADRFPDLFALEFHFRLEHLDIQVKADLVNMP